MTRSELGKLSRNGDLVFSVLVQVLYNVIKSIHHFFVSVLCHANVFRVGGVKIGVQHGPPVDERLIQLVTLRTGDARKVLDLLLNFEHVVVYLSNHE